MEGHSIPEAFGAIEPTAVFIPLKEIMSEKYIGLVTTEVFGPVQVQFNVFFFVNRISGADRIQR